MFAKVKLALSRLRGAGEQLPYLPRALALVWTAARQWTLAWIVLLVVQGLLPGLSVSLTRVLVDSLVAGLGSGATRETLQPTLVLVALLAGILLLGELLRSLSGWIRTTQSELVRDYVSGLIHEKAAVLDLAFYDSPDYYDTLYRARIDAQSKPVALLESVGSLVQNTITLAVMAAVLLPYGVWLPLVLLLSTLPAFYVVLDYTVRQYQWRLRTTAGERRSWYYDYLLTARESAAELRLFGLSGHFRAAFQELRQRLRLERARLARDQGLAELAAGGLALLVTGLAMAWMVWRAVQGQATLGDLALFYQAFNQGQRLMRSLLESAGQIYSNILFLGNLFDFLRLQPEIVDPAQPAPLRPLLQGGIRFEGVTFRYPGSERPALQDFTLAIPAGQIVAIVGANGAGKSTLVKLLCRFYDPDQGCVALDGLDLRQLPLETLRRRITVLFQEPVRYNHTVAENIALGDLPAGPAMDDIEAAARAAGADGLIGRLPQGYQTWLGRWFKGGTDLSVGEWQRVSLARAFLRQAQIVVLDEPTSAMDSWAENDWMDRFRQLVAGRTALIITHRFTTAMRADVIHVMEDGRVVESGSHQQLLAQNGRYAQSWRAQVQAHAQVLK
ncbi:MAG: ABC transporter ATP-binding protein/permease [Chloroflexi bacterium]|nr:ABC transporter ATP-binding protein/permease [Chloroflexota bacterium]